MGATWIIGAVLAAFGSIASNLGVNTQKYSFMKNAALPEHLQKPYTRQPAWCFGMALVVFGSIGDFSALALAAESIVSPIGSITLVANVVFAHYWLKESINHRELGATGLIVVGAVLSAIFGDHNEVHYTVSILLRFFGRALFIIYAVFTTAAGLAMWGVVRRASPMKHKIVAAKRRYDEAVLKGDAEQMDYEDFYITNLQINFKKYERIHPFCVCALSGVCGAQSVMFGKMVSELFSTTLRGDIQMDSIFFWLFVAGMTASVVSQLHFLADALNLYDALYVVPVFQCFFISVSAIGGACFFGEFNDFNTVQSVFFPLGLLLTLSGVLILSGRKMGEDSAHSQKERARLAFEAKQKQQQQQQYQQQQYLHEHQELMHGQQHEHQQHQQHAIQLNGRPLSQAAHRRQTSKQVQRGSPNAHHLEAIREDSDEEFVYDEEVGSMVRRLSRTQPAPVRGRYDPRVIPAHIGDADALLEDDLGGAGGDSYVEEEHEIAAYVGGAAAATRLQRAARTKRDARARARAGAQAGAVDPSSSMNVQHAYGTTACTGEDDAESGGSDVSTLSDLDSDSDMFASGMSDDDCGGGGVGAGGAHMRSEFDRYRHEYNPHEKASAFADPEQMTRSAAARAAAVRERVRAQLGKSNVGASRARATAATRHPHEEGTEAMLEQEQEGAFHEVGGEMHLDDRAHAHAAASTSSRRTSPAIAPVHVSTGSASASAASSAAGTPRKSPLVGTTGGATASQQVPHLVSSTPSPTARRSGAFSAAAAAHAIEPSGSSPTTPVLRGVTTPQFGPTSQDVAGGGSATPVLSGSVAASSSTSGSPSTPTTAPATSTTPTPRLSRMGSIIHALPLPPLSLPNVLAETPGAPEASTSFLHPGTNMYIAPPSFSSDDNNLSQIQKYSSVVHHVGGLVGVPLISAVAHFYSVGYTELAAGAGGAGGSVGGGAGGAPTAAAQAAAAAAQAAQAAASQPATPSASAEQAQLQRDIERGEALMSTQAGAPAIEMSEITPVGVGTAVSSGPATPSSAASSSSSSVASSATRAKNAIAAFFSGGSQAAAASAAAASSSATTPTSSVPSTPRARSTPAAAAVEVVPIAVATDESDAHDDDQDDQDDDDVGGREVESGVVPHTEEDKDDSVV